MASPFSWMKKVFLNAFDRRMTNVFFGTQESLLHLYHWYFVWVGKALANPTSSL